MFCTARTPAYAFPGSSAFCLVQKAFPASLTWEGASHHHCHCLQNEGLCLGLSHSWTPSSQEGGFTAGVLQMCGFSAVTSPRSFDVMAIKPHVGSAVQVGNGNPGSNAP